MERKGFPLDRDENLNESSQLPQLTSARPSGVRQKQCDALRQSSEISTSSCRCFVAKPARASEYHAIESIHGVRVHDESEKLLHVSSHFVPLSASKLKGGRVSKLCESLWTASTPSLYTPIFHVKAARRCLTCTCIFLFLLKHSRYKLLSQRLQEQQRAVPRRQQRICGRNGCRQSRGRGGGAREWVWQGEVERGGLASRGRGRRGIALRVGLREEPRLPAVIN
jgi:hypothetical protein